jgi:multiple RNA-binding domain-containing protein 1
MESSRVFVKNLPPTISEAEFRKHFSAQGREVTDVKLIPHRRIGFVGYKSHDDAARAVKYLNRSFIRMSRVSVDLAKPVSATSAPQLVRSATNHRCKIADSAPKPAAKSTPGHGVSKPFLHKSGDPEVEQTEDANLKKRKREALDEADPKLQEYLEVMGHQAKKPRDQDTLNGNMQSESMSALPSAVLDAGESDDEYEHIPTHLPQRPIQGTPGHVDATPAPVAAGKPPALAPPDEPAKEVPQVSTEATDDDWLRSRTSRLLDLVDPDDPGFVARPPPSAPVVAPASKPQEQPHGDGGANADVPSEALLSKGEGPDDTAELVDKTSRLFLRNLSYAVTEDDIREHFSTFGTLEEVGISLFSFFFWNPCLL